MKKIIKNTVLISALAALMIFTGCEQFQGMLSSEQQKEMDLATGVAGLSGNTWYYNGTAGENISPLAEINGDKYCEQTLKVQFSKQVAIKELSGNMILTYTDSDGFQNTKTITSLKGTFGSDYKSFNLDMSEVVRLLDGTTIPSGTANLEIKLGGFICAEGSQKGRPVSTLNQKISVQPFFQTTKVDFSTCWYVHGQSVIKLLVNDTFALTAAASAYKVGSGSEQFTITADGKNLVFTPETDVHGKIDSYSFPVYGILPDSNGSSFMKEIQVNLVDRAIIIDGEKDGNYSVDRAVEVEDEETDQTAFGHDDWALTFGDLKKISIVNDDSNLYVGLSGTMTVNWKDGIVLMIGKAGDSANDATSSNYKAAETTTYWHGRPNVYLYHQPGFENTGKGQFTVLAGAAKNNISKKCSAAPYGWTSSTNGDFVEYAIPLSDAGFAKGDKLKVIAALSLNWDEGNAVCDVLPSSAVRSENNERTQVQFTFDNAVEFTIK